MSAGQFEPFGPHELDDPAISERPDEKDLAEALAVGKQLELIASGRPMRPSAGFEDRVWAAISAEPVPAPATAAREALRRHSPRGLVLSLADARRVAFGANRPWRARSRAAVLLLAAMLVIGSLGGAAAVGALSLLAPAPAVVTPPSVTPEPTLPSPSLPEPSPSPSADESESPEPGESEGPPSEGPGQTDEPLDTDDPGETPDPSETPKPSDSPSESPEPSASDD